MPSDNERLQAAAAGLQSRFSGKMGNVWWTFMLRGLLALGLGISALIWPKLTLGLLVRLIGIYAMLDGAAGFISGIRSRDLQSYLVPALVSLAVGAVLLFWPGAGAVTISWLVAALAFVVGTMLVFLALRLRRVKLRVDRLGNVSR
jgi:uncharacterized membrane protein HdeD (DUF308 family)